MTEKHDGDERDVQDHKIDNFLELNRRNLLKGSAASVFGLPLVADRIGGKVNESSVNNLVPIDQILISANSGNAHAGDTGRYRFDNFEIGNTVIEDFGDGAGDWRSVDAPKVDLSVENGVGVLEYVGKRGSVNQKLIKEFPDNASNSKGEYRFEVKAEKKTADDFVVVWGNSDLEPPYFHYFGVDFSRETTGNIHLFARSNEANDNLNLGKQMPLNEWMTCIFKNIDWNQGTGTFEIRRQNGSTFLTQDFVFNPKVSDDIIVEQDGRSFEVTPLSNGESIENFYNYSDGESNTSTNIERSDTSLVFLWDGPNGTSLVVIHDAPGDGSGGAATFNFTGLPDNGDWVIKDDDPASTDDRFSQAKVDWGWKDRHNDGGAYRGGLDDSFEITIDPAFNQEANLTPTSPGKINSWRFLSGDPNNPTTHQLDLNKPITIRRGKADGQPQIQPQIDEKQQLINGIQNSADGFLPNLPPPAVPETEARAEELLNRIQEDFETDSLTQPEEQYQLALNRMTSTERITEVATVAPIDYIEELDKLLINTTIGLASQFIGGKAATKIGGKLIGEKVVDVIIKGMFSHLENITANLIPPASEVENEQKDLKDCAEDAYKSHLDEFERVGKVDVESGRDAAKQELRQTELFNELEKCRTGAVLGKSLYNSEYYNAPSHFLDVDNFVDDIPTIEDLENSIDTEIDLESPDWLPEELQGLIETAENVTEFSLNEIKENLDEIRQVLEIAPQTYSPRQIKDMLLTTSRLGGAIDTGINTHINEVSADISDNLYTKTNYYSQSEAQIREDIERLSRNSLDVLGFSAEFIIEKLKSLTDAISDILDGIIEFAVAYFLSIRNAIELLGLFAVILVLLALSFVLGSISLVISAIGSLVGLKVFPILKSIHGAGTEIIANYEDLTETPNI